MSTVITSRKIAANVRIWRDYIGIKQQVVADELGICREWYVKLENGQSNFSIEQLLTIARLFDIEPEVFFKERVKFDKQKSTYRVGIENELEYLVEQKIIEVISKLFRKMEM
ncbi:MAG: helix-turn-helix transcriptional regulator [Haliscomenobacter sp.]|uniref:helix-turn-helix domain-containing protein n=1 Tax=Haliscomenobacter sp. TaxID=2717303 RepID=UPI0029BC4C9E|nr:helix-turn-helix transcriptional regulator [Haliscomenobacter sp.]MDX2067107.1 helix-turn-helix transcriptional regulator [Haliscomenobacter sp.]